MFFQSIWRSVLHHIRNTHVLALSHGKVPWGCLHEPLTKEDRDITLLNPSKHTPALKALAGLVGDKRMLGKV